MSFFDQRLLVRKPRASEAESSRNTITFGNEWTNIRRSNTESQTLTQCLEETGTSCMQIDSRRELLGTLVLPQALSRRQEEEEEEMGVTIDFFGVNATVQTSVWTTPIDACDKWVVAFDLSVDGGSAGGIEIGDSERGFNLAAFGNFLPIDLLGPGDLPLADRDHSLRFRLDRNTFGFVGNAVGCGPDTLVSLRIDYAVITISPRSPINPKTDELIVDSHDSTLVKYQGDGWVSSILPEHEMPMDAAFGFRSMDSTIAGDSVEMTFLGTSVDVFIRSSTFSFLVSVDGSEDYELKLWMGTADFKVAGDSVFQARNLSPDTNHTVKLTIQSDDEAGTFSFLGFVYTPTFTSLDEGQKLLASVQTGSPSNEATPTDSTKATPPDSGRTGNDTPGRSNNLAGTIPASIGGSIGLLLLILGALFWRRRRQRRAALSRASSFAADNDMTESVNVEARSDAQVPHVVPAEGSGTLPTPYVKSYYTLQDIHPGDDLRNESNAEVLLARRDAHLPTPYMKSYMTRPDQSEREYTQVLQEDQEQGLPHPLPQHPGGSVLDTDDLGSRDPWTGLEHQHRPIPDEDLSDIQELGYVGSSGAARSSTSTRGVGEVEWVLMSRRAAREQPPPYAS